MSKSVLWDVLGPALAIFWLHFACPAVAWPPLFRLFVDTEATLCRKVGSCDIDASLERNRCLCKSGQPSWSHLGRKVAPKWFKVASKGMSERSGQSSFAGRLGLAVKAMEIAGNRRTAARPQVKPKVKVYLSDKSYD